MTLIVETPDTRPPERDYILGVVLGEFLGLPWRRLPADRADIRITLEDHPGELCLPDVLLSTPEADWLQSASLPARPLRRWNAHELATDITLVEPFVPVIYGDHANSVGAQPPGRSNSDSGVAAENNRDSDTQAPFVCREDDRVALPIDIFGSAFFMLTRYEELVVTDRDEHDRFPAWASLAYQEGFLERPIVDEYVEILWTAMQRLWPQLERRSREARVRVSHDVDRPSRYSFGPFRRFVRSVAGDIAKRGDLASVVRGPAARYGRRQALHPADPFNTFDWLMDISEANGLQSAFYFIPGKTYAPHDPLYDLDDPKIRDLIARIAERGHEVGLHPGYHTYRDPQTLTTQADRLRQVSHSAGVNQQEWGGRMHYLQWDSQVTPQAWEQAGMTYDSTLGYADHAGFRCGTSHDFPLFSWAERRALGVMERPLIAMEGTILSAKYMGFSEADDVRGYLSTLRSRCHQFDGAFNLLWHNSELVGKEIRMIYQDMVAGSFR
ncbi:polysaccharide deacetylase family protein [Thioalkalivibrio sp. ALE12]|uniref:polysaccharide deacetylase family protein n=1 Tax=Thioalkalivibrio sp. ALE12 TaxID=1158170 RepID=UPI00037DB0E2|nr:polysaccharide deacetylase family protein [Thioalkalivibrio sp. ALE12]